MSLPLACSPLELPLAPPYPPPNIHSKPSNMSFKGLPPYLAPPLPNCS